MSHNQEPRAIPPFGRCLLCESAGEPPVAVCRRCGAFVCREHALRLVHRPSQTPIGLMVPRARRNDTHLEMVCEACYLNDLASREQAV